MALIRQLFSDWVGILSLIVMITMVGVIIYVLAYVMRRVKKG